MSNINLTVEENKTSIPVKPLTNFEEITAALAGLFTAGPLGALASLVAIRGLQGKWTNWFIIGIPSVIVINTFYVGVFYAYSTIANKFSEKTEVTQQTSKSTLPKVITPVARLVEKSSGFYQAGIAVGGQNVRVDLSTIRQISNRGETEFIYYLGNERISSIANCAEETWVTLPEFKTHTPQSEATQSMINRVCKNFQNNGGPVISSSGAAIVFDPPSNIRSTPNGGILCSVTSRGSIPIQDKEGDWYKTDYCGSPGYIHKGQIKF